MIMEVETSFFMILLGTRAVKMSFTFPLYLVSIRFYACSLCWQKRAMAPFINIGSFFHTLFPHSLNHDVSDFPFSPTSFLILYLSFFSLYICMAIKAGEMWVVFWTFFGSLIDLYLSWPTFLDINRFVGGELIPRVNLTGIHINARFVYCIRYTLFQRQWWRYLAHTKLTKYTSSFKKRSPL